LLFQTGLLGSQVDKQAFESADVGGGDAGVLPLDRAPDRRIAAGVNIIR
jgi:hypothetical protein